MKEQKKKLYSSRVHEHYSNRGYSSHNLTKAEIDSIKESIDVSDDKIAFANGRAPKDITEVITRYIKQGEAVAYVRGNNLVLRRQYYTRSRIDAYRLASYYFKNVDIHEVYTLVNSMCRHLGYCYVARRHMFK